MKTILLILALLCGLKTEAQLNFANTNSGQIVQFLPTKVQMANSNWMSNADSNTLVSLGWLTVSNAQTVTAGYAITAYSIVPVGGGWCNLTISASNNIQAVFNAAITNRQIWTPGFVSVLQDYRSVIRSYDGFGSESNAVVSLTTTEAFFATNAPFIQISTNVFNAAFLNDLANDIVALPGITNTAQFWRLGLVP